MFTSGKPIAVYLERVEDKPDTIWCKNGWRYEGGAFRSTIFTTEREAVESIKRRFPAAEIDGKPIMELYPDIKPKAAAMPIDNPATEAEQPAPPSQSVNPSKTANPHVFVAGPDGYCLLCDNKEPNPIHVAGGMKPAKKNKKDTSPHPTDETGNLF